MPPIVRLLLMLTIASNVHNLIRHYTFTGPLKQSIIGSFPVYFFTLIKQVCAVGPCPHDDGHWSRHEHYVPLGLMPHGHISQHQMVVIRHHGISIYENMHSTARTSIANTELSSRIRSTGHNLNSVSYREAKHK